MTAFSTLLSLRRTMATTAAVAAAVLIGSASTTASQAAADTADRHCAMTRTGEYPTAAPEQVGLDPAILRRAVDYWTQNGAETVKVFRHGCLAGQGGLDSSTGSRGRTGARPRPWPRSSPAWPRSRG